MLLQKLSCVIERPIKIKHLKIRSFKMILMALIAKFVGQAGQHDNSLASFSQFYKIVLLRTTFPVHNWCIHLFYLLGKSKGFII